MPYIDSGALKLFRRLSRRCRCCANTSARRPASPRFVDTSRGAHHRAFRDAV